MSGPEQGDPALAIVPPRPSPGPEPVAASLTTAGATAVLITAAMLVAGAVVVWRRSKGHAPVPPRAPGPWDDLAYRVRQALVARFGPDAATWTSPEWSTHPDVVARFGPDRAAVLGAFARESDAARFGPGTALQTLNPGPWRDRLAFLFQPGDDGPE